MAEPPKDPEILPARLTCPRRSDGPNVGRVEHYLAADLRRIADALESYLPPE